MSDEEEEIERRGRPRAGGIPGTAIVLGKNDTASFTIENLSASGAALVGAIEIPTGERVRLLLHVDGQSSLSATAEVIRAECTAADQHRVAVKFRDVDPETQGRIDAIVVAAIERDWIAAAPAVLVVDDDPAMVAAAERDLRELGYVVASATTSLELVRQMNDRSLRIEAALVDLSLKHVNAVGLLAHLIDEHPRVVRIITSSRALSDDSTSMIASRRAHARLQKPWDRQTLIDAIGVGCGSPSSAEP